MTDLADLERRRLRSLVEPRPEEAERLHAPDFRIVTPSGGVWTRAEYLGGIAAGDIDYRRFEPTSEIEVLADGALAVVRYRSLIDIAVRGQQPGPLRCWHLDVYRKGPTGWQVRWSQATEILRPDVPGSS